MADTASQKRRRAKRARQRVKRAQGLNSRAFLRDLIDMVLGMDFR